jgi:hypothetical protein
MTTTMPREIWVRGTFVYNSPHSVYSCNRDGSNVVFAKDARECTGYTLTSEYTALLEVARGMAEALGELKPYLEKSMKRLEARKRQTRLATPESHDFYSAMHDGVEALTAWAALMEGQKS